MSEQMLREPAELAALREAFRDYGQSVYGAGTAQSGVVDRLVEAIADLLRAAADKPTPAGADRDAITADRTWASGYAAGRAAALRSVERGELVPDPVGAGLREALEAMWAQHEDAADYCGFNRATFEKHRDTILTLAQSSDGSLGAAREKARRWRERGMFTDAEWGAVCAVLYVGDAESVTDADREWARDQAARLTEHSDAGEGEDRAH